MNAPPPPKPSKPLTTSPALTKVLREAEEASSKLNRILIDLVAVLQSNAPTDERSFDRIGVTREYLSGCVIRMAQVDKCFDRVLSEQSPRNGFRMLCCIVRGMTRVVTSCPCIECLAIAKDHPEQNTEEFVFHDIMKQDFNIDLRAGNNESAKADMLEIRGLAIPGAARGHQDPLH